MFSFGWSEIALTFIVVVIIVGPKEIPNLLRQIGRFSKSIKKISREFKNSLNEITEEKEIKDVKKTLSDITKITDDAADLVDEAAEEIDPEKINKKIMSSKENKNIFENEIKNIDAKKNDEKK
tara:strand:+ start:118 stop:486 length:369 start_codon:yes stop_codon:yes gene_type:complete